ncbi:MAG: hypothetical protein K6F95_05960 [Selenomonas sp.]|uniref:MATE family efflux transporter n=1 Tax=Selenomonas sp. TaxID=2053611 RepID=UPI0025CB9260|nr:MATE family efflux transporter [Selenomonas sp.]MCR5757433.1 hypothetical protein [Selenomonas sp.]
MNPKIDYAYFTRRMFFHAVLPAPLAAIGLSLAEMGDTILVGHAIGMDGLAAVGFVSPLFLLATFFVFGLSMGGAIVFSNLMHEGKKEDALGLFNFCLRLSAVVGFTITAAGLLFEDSLLAMLGTGPQDGVVYEMVRSYILYILLGIPFEILMEVLTAYLRNDNADNLSVVIQGASGVVNLGISALLLFVFDWGIAGCSFGFFIANLLAVGIALGYILFRKDGELSLRSRTIPWRDAIKPLRLGFATSSEYIFDAIFTLAAIHLVLELAGTDGVAVFNIIENLSLLFIFLYEFIGKTSQPLFSTFFAEGNQTELHRTFRYALGYSLFWGILATLLVILYPQILDLLFGLEDIQDAELAYYAARVFCIGTIFMGLTLLLQNYLQTEEDEKGAFLIVFLRRLGVSMPLAFLLAEFGFAAFWLVYPLAEIGTLIILYLYKRKNGEQVKLSPERIYSASFLGKLAVVAEQLDAIEAFAAQWGADSQKRHTLRLAVEEICGLMAERAQSMDDDSLLTQLTLLAKEDGSFQLHLRNNGEKLDPLSLISENLAKLSAQKENYDIRLLVLHAVKSHAQQFLYRNYQGFNTITLTI